MKVSRESDWKPSILYLSMVCGQISFTFDVNVSLPPTELTDERMKQVEIFAEEIGNPTHHLFKKKYSRESPYSGMFQSCSYSCFCSFLMALIQAQLMKRSQSRIKRLSIESLYNHYIIIVFTPQRCGYKLQYFGYKLQ